MIRSIGRELGACSFVHNRIIGAIGGFLGGGPAGAVAGFVGGGGTTTPRPSYSDPVVAAAQGFGPSTCQPGYTRNPSSGVCEEKGIVGAARRFVPGGQTGTQVDIGGDAVVGSFGLTGVLPSQVGTITRNDGGVTPLLRCPARYVLAIDNICYVKGQRGLAAFRKWKPEGRAFLTPGDVKVLRRANSLRNSKGSKKLLRELGLG